jgi:hypothetical protein
MQEVKLFRVSTEDIMLHNFQDYMFSQEYETSPTLFSRSAGEPVYLKEKTHCVPVTHIKVNGESHYGAISPELQVFVDALISEKVQHLVIAHKAEKVLSEGNLSVLKARITLFNNLPWYKRIFQKDLICIS